MKSSCLIRLAAIFILIAFAISFFLPVCHNIILFGAGDTIGWQQARETFNETFHPEGPWGIAKIYLILSAGLFDLANLVTPLILLMLATGWSRDRIPLFVLIILTLFAANAAQFVTDHLLVGYWAWWGCQLATLAIGIQSRFCPRQMVLAQS